MWCHLNLWRGEGLEQVVIPGGAAELPHKGLVGEEGKRETKAGREKPGAMEWPEATGQGEAQAEAQRLAAASSDPQESFGEPYVLVSGSSCRDGIDKQKQLGQDII